MTPSPCIAQGPTVYVYKYTCIMIRQVGFSLEFSDSLECRAGTWQHGKSWPGPMAALTSLGSALDCWGFHPYCMHTPHKWLALGHPMDLGVHTPVGLSTLRTMDLRKPPRQALAVHSGLFGQETQGSQVHWHTETYLSSYPSAQLILSSSCIVNLTLAMDPFHRP